VIALGIPILIVVICAMVGMWMQVRERDSGVPVVAAEIRVLEDMYTEKNNLLWDVYKGEKLDVIRNNERMQGLWDE
jgi:hypothetical protein